MDEKTKSERIASWRGLMQAHSLVVDAVEADLRASGALPLSWHEVLARLEDAPDGSLRMQDLAEQLGVSRSGLTRLVDRIEAARLVERASCPSDRRGTYAVLTEAGRKALAEAQPRLERAVQEHFGRYLDEAEAGELKALLGKVVVGHAHSLAAGGAASGCAKAAAADE